MKKTSSDLARSITWTGSKQTYFTARLLVDKDLVNDFYRAYAYLRWVDDFIDIESQADVERISFIKKQRLLIEGLYSSEIPNDLIPEEEIIADLIRHDNTENSGLQSFIRNMFNIIEFDAHRKGRLISEQELTWYSDCVAKSVTDGIQYFIGKSHPYPNTENRYLAGNAAHITHLLRDMLQDTADGFINIPREHLEKHSISPEDISSHKLQAWVQKRVKQARQYFHEGRRYLDGLDLLRCKIVGLWYCARFESVLDTIEQDDYILRESYNERRQFATWIKIAWLGVTITLRHIARRVLSGWR